MKKLLFATALLSLAACSPAAVQDVQKGLVAACATYGQVLSVLADAKGAGKLSASSIATIDKVVAVADPICTAPVPPTDIASATSVIQAESAILTTLIPAK